MLSLPLSVRVFASTTPIEFNIDVDGLVRIVRDDFCLDPFSGNLFCFFNRRRDRVKILMWDRNGFWTLCKRLERGHFEPFDTRAAWIEISREKTVMLFSGIDTRTSRFRRNYVRDVRIVRRGDDDRPASTSQ